MKIADHTYCHKCGTAYETNEGESQWPKICPNDLCKNQQWFNPIPIGVLLQTVTDGKRTGVLTPVRGINPMAGYPALIGGYQEGWDHSSEEAALREFVEEIGLKAADKKNVDLLCSQATGPFLPGLRQNLVFSVTRKPMDIENLQKWVPNEETREMIISWAPRVLAFPSHTYALAHYFKKNQGVASPRRYLEQPRVGDKVNTPHGEMEIFNIPYHQPLLNDDIWIIEYEHEEEIHIHYHKDF